MKSKFEMEKSKRNKHKTNVVLKGNKKNIKTDMISVTWPLSTYLLYAYVIVNIIQQLYNKIHLI